MAAYAEKLKTFKYYHFVHFAIYESIISLSICAYAYSFMDTFPTEKFQTAWHSKTTDRWMARFVITYFTLAALDVLFNSLADTVSYVSYLFGLPILQQPQLTIETYFKKINIVKKLCSVEVACLCLSAGLSIDLFLVYLCAMLFPFNYDSLEFTIDSYWPFSLPMIYAVFYGLCCDLIFIFFAMNFLK